MAEHDPDLIEKAAKAIYDSYGKVHISIADALARAVLDAVALHHADFCDAQYNVESYREQWLRAESLLSEETEALSRVLAVHAEYFDLDREPFDDASPEPEDVWRYDRDFRAALNNPNTSTEQRN